MGVEHASIAIYSRDLNDQEEQRTAGVSIEDVSKQWSGNPVYIRLLACSYTKGLPSLPRQFAVHVCLAMLLVFLFCSGVRSECS